MLRCAAFLYVAYYIEFKKPNRRLGAGTYRILCIGESTTKGPKDGNGYPEQLERMLNTNFPDKRFRVFNLGVPAVTSTEIARHFKKNIIDYKPDLVILLVGNNDNKPRMFYVLDNGRALNKILNYAVNEMNELKIVKLSKFSYEILVGALNNTLDLQRMYSDIYINFKMPNHSCWLKQEHRKNLEYMTGVAIENKCKVLICNYFYSPANIFLREFSRDNNIPFCDNQKIFKGYKNARFKLISEDGWHPNVKGYSIIAKNLLDAIVENNLICN